MSIIQETFTLPSHGKIYDCAVSETVTLRSMNTEDEMKRLSPSITPYKSMCDLIDGCTMNDVGISSYDMCMGDYQFLLYKLRIVTYGPEYLNSSICPFCGNENISKKDLDKLAVQEWTEDYQSQLELELPVSKKKVTLKFLTPRDLDDIEKQKMDFARNNPDYKFDLSVLYNLKKSILLIDGKRYDYVKLENFLRKLPMKDTNILLQTATKLNDRIGLDASFEETCKNPKCELTYRSTFRLTTEFFRPTI